LGPTEPSRPRVAIVHDYLTQRGGAERVVAILAGAFPEAPLYTSLYEPSQTFDDFAALDVRPGLINRVPVLRRDPRKAFPLLAPTFSRTKVDAELVLATSSGWAHGVGGDAIKVVYCFAPARWLYQADRYIGSAGRGSAPFRTAARIATGLGGAPLRRWDQRAAQRATRYMTTSRAMAAMIRDTYGIDAEVIPPPPALTSTGPVDLVAGLDPGFRLTVSRLLPYKNVDVVLEVARQDPSRQLVVVGEGPLRSALEAAAPSNVVFLPNVSDAELRWLYRNASALLAASYEDFGLTPLEAAALGTPTVALRAGGYLDTIVEGVTGAFFDSLHVGEISTALNVIDEVRPDAAVLERHASSFSRERFCSRIVDVVNVELQR